MTGWWFALLCGCANAPGSGSRVPGEHPRLEYAVRVSDDFRRLDVTACPIEFFPRVLVPGNRVAHYITRDPVAVGTGKPLPYVRRARYIGAGRRKFPVHRGHVELDDLAPGDCVRYRVDTDELRKMRKRESEGPPWFASSTGAWLWRPRTRPDGLEVTMRLEIPAGARAFVPWREIEPGHYRLDAHVFEYASHVSIGHFRVVTVERRGTAIDVAVLGLESLSDDDVHGWIGDTVGDVSVLYDGPTAPYLQVSLVSSGAWNGGPVGFGQVQRGGTHLGVALWMNENARAEELRGDWQSIHELIHTGMPYIEGMWCAEGFTTYLTSLVVTRSGRRSVEEGWRTLADFVLNGQAWSPDPYWRGAALAFLLDVEIRRRSQGARSFDDAVRHLHRCCAAASRTLSADALLERLDQWYGEPLFSELVARHKANPQPAVQDALERLGVHVDGETVSLVTGAPLAHVREAMLGPTAVPGESEPPGEGSNPSSAPADR